MKEDYEKDNKNNKKKFPKVVQIYLKEIMSCHSERSKISIRVHKRHTIHS